MKFKDHSVYFWKTRREKLLGISGNDKEFTIFDALLESFIKKRREGICISSFTKAKSFSMECCKFITVFMGFERLTWIREIVRTGITFYGKDIVTILMGSRVGKTLVWD